MAVIGETLREDAAPSGAASSLTTGTTMPSEMTVSSRISSNISAATALEESSVDGCVVSGSVSSCARVASLSLHRREELASQTAISPLFPVVCSSGFGGLPVHSDGFPCLGNAEDTSIPVLLEGFTTVAEFSDGFTTVAEFSDGFTTIAERSDGFTTVAECLDGFTTIAERSDGFTTAGELFEGFPIHERADGFPSSVTVEERASSPVHLDGSLTHERTDGFPSLVSAEHLHGFPNQERAQLLNRAEVPEGCTSIRKSDGSVEHSGRFREVYHYGVVEY